MKWIVGIIILVLLVIIGYQTVVIGKLQNSSVSSSAKAQNAGLFTYWINNQESKDWLQYKNFDYSYSFLFPASWKVDLSNDHTEIVGLSCYGCGGGTKGIYLNYYSNTNKLSMDGLIKQNNQYDSDPSALESYSGNKNLKVKIDRSVPGQSGGEAAYISDSDNSKLVVLYCNDCTDQDTNNIVNSFSFN